MARSARQTVLILSDGACSAAVDAAFLRQGTLKLVRHDEVGSAAEAIRAHSPDLIIQELDESLDRLLASELEGTSCAAIPCIRFYDATSCPVSRPGQVLPLPLVQRDYFLTVKKFVRLPKRRALRHDINLRFVYEDGEGTFHAFSTDLSIYGAFLKTDREMVEGQRLRLSFNLPGHRRGIRCAGVVRQAAPVSSDPHALPGFGIEFEGMGDEDLARLQQFIERNTRRSVFSLLPLG